MKCCYFEFQVIHVYIGYLVYPPVHIILHLKRGVFSFCVSKPLIIFHRPGFWATPPLEIILLSLIIIIFLILSFFSCSWSTVFCSCISCSSSSSVALALCLLSRTTKKIVDFLAVFSLETGTQSSAMVILVSRVKDLQWKISMKQVYQKLMVRWLPALVCLMVSLLITTYHNLDVQFKNRWSLSCSFMYS